MKRILLIAGAALLLLLCWRLIHQAPGSQDANSTEGGTAQAATVQHEITKSSPVQSGTAVFQRAFWKRPTLDDTILQAELREWTGEENIPHWQWFIVLEPSADLLKDLIEDNAFSLIPAHPPSAMPDAPNWFDFEHSEIEALHSRTGNKWILLNRKQNILYATDTGQVFSQGAQDPVQPYRQVTSEGRLPSTPPPVPPQP